MTGEGHPSPAVQRSPEPVEWKPDATGTPVQPPYCGRCGRYHWQTTAICNPAGLAALVPTAQEVADADRWLAAFRRGMERALALVEAEYLTENTGTDDDAAYQQAITDAATSIRAEIAAHTNPTPEKRS